MMGGEAAMIVALADSFFFDVDLSAARSRILLFLLVSFTPFLVIAPLIGPVIDRIRGGRRFVVQAVAVARIVVQVLMIRYADELALFPLVFAALVLQKTYAVSKSALVPSVVTSERELVEANSKLGVIAGVTGAVAVAPAGLLQITLGTGATLAYGALIFVVALVASLRLPHEVVVVDEAARRGALPPLPAPLRAAADAMFVLRCCVGFVLFQLAFWFRAEDAATIWFAAAVGAASLGTMLGNVVGPRVRAHLAEERMLFAALVLPVVAGVVTALFAAYPAGVVLAGVVNFSAAVARLAFESLVQRDAPGVNRGQVFARFETRFQLGWVMAATVPVVVTLPGPLGLLAVAVIAGAGLVRYRAASSGGRRRGRPSSRGRTAAPRPASRGGISPRSPGPTRDPGRRSR